MKLRKAAALLGLVIGFDVAFLLSILGYVWLAFFLASTFISAQTPDVDQMKHTTRLAALAGPLLFLSLCFCGVGVGYSIGARAEERDPGTQDAKSSRVQWWFSMLSGISLAVLLVFIAFFIVIAVIGRHLSNQLRS